jgi:hypothetical protein
LAAFFYAFLQTPSFSSRNPLNHATYAINTACKVKRKKIDFGAVAGSLFYPPN